MSVEGINSSFSSPFSPGAAAAHAASAAKGVFLGHAVAEVESPLSILADAAEEIGFAVDRTKDYELTQRKEREASDAGRKLLEQYRRVMQSVNAQALNSCIEQLRRSYDAQSMRRAIEEAFKDPTDAWAAFEAAAEAFESDPAVSLEQKRALSAAKDAFLAENGKAARLGLQGALAQSGYPEVGGAEAARSFYRSAVGEFSSVKEVFADIQKQYGDDFDKAMDFLFAALSADISSDMPSMEKTHLENVHQKLGLVRLAKSAYLECADVMKRWTSVHGVKQSGLDAMGLLGSLLELQGRSFVSAGDFDRIAMKAGAPDIEREVLFRQDLLSALRRFPTALFNDEEGFVKVADACQSSLDAAIEREDEWLASQ